MSTIKADNIATLAGVSTSVSSVVYGSAKAWVNLDAINGIILSSFNVTSITDIGTGVFAINLTNALTNTNYVVVGGVEYKSGGSAVAAVSVSPNTKTTSSFQMAAEDVDGGFTDYPSFMAVVFG